MFVNFELVKRIIDFIEDNGYKYDSIKDNGILFFSREEQNYLSITNITDFTYICSGFRGICYKIAIHFGLGIDEIGGIEIR